MVEIWIRGDPEEIVDVSTPEAAAEFKRKRDAGDFGVRNQAEYEERQRMVDLFEKYEDEMSFVEFLDRHTAGTLPEKE